MPRRISSSVELAMEYGGVRRVREYLSDASYLVSLRERPDGAAIIRRAEEWLAEAEAHEAVHGLGSMLDGSGYAPAGESREDPA